jgi:hypothetical protein
MISSEQMDTIMDRWIGRYVIIHNDDGNSCAKELGVDENHYVLAIIIPVESDWSKDYITNQIITLLEGKSDDVIPSDSCIYIRVCKAEEM